MIQARRRPITAALRYSTVGAYLACVAFISVSAVGWQARAIETGLALVPAVVVLAGVLLWRFVQHVRGLEAEERKRPLQLASIVLLVVLAVLGGTWIYVESRPPAPVVEVDLLLRGLAGAPS